MPIRLTILRTVISGCVPLERTRRIMLLRWVESNVSMFVSPNVGQAHPRTLLFWERIFSTWEKRPSRLRSDRHHAWGGRAQDNPSLHCYSRQVGHPEGRNANHGRPVPKAASRPGSVVDDPRREEGLEPQSSGSRFGPPRKYIAAGLLDSPQFPRLHPRCFGFAGGGGC